MKTTMCWCIVWCCCCCQHNNKRTTTQSISVTDCVCCSVCVFAADRESQQRLFSRKQRSPDWLLHLRRVHANRWYWCKGTVNFNCNSGSPWSTFCLRTFKPCCLSVSGLVMIHYKRLSACVNPLNVSGLHGGSWLRSRRGQKVPRSGWESGARQWREGDPVSGHADRLWETSGSQSLPGVQGKLESHEKSAKLKLSWNRLVFIRNYLVYLISRLFWWRSSFIDNGEKVKSSKMLHNWLKVRKYWQ